MNEFFVVIIFLLLVGAILLAGEIPHKKRSREQFLQALAKFLVGKLEPIDDGVHENSFRITFTYLGKEFVYEDLEKHGFKEKVYIANLRVKAPSRLTLTFSEKKRTTRIRTDIFIASDIPTKRVGKYIELNVPKGLGDMNVSTNDPEGANILFEDKRIAATLKQFKNFDSRGYPFLSLEIIDGNISLDFYSKRIFYPNLFVLQADVSSIEDYLDKMMVFVRKFQENS